MKGDLKKKKKLVCQMFSSFTHTHTQFPWSCGYGQLLICTGKAVNPTHASHLDLAFSKFPAVPPHDRNKRN